MKFYLISLLMHAGILGLILYFYQPNMKPPVKDYTRIKIVEKERVATTTKPPAPSESKKPKKSKEPSSKSKKKVMRPEGIQGSDIDPKILLGTADALPQDDELHYGMDPVLNLRDQSVLQKFAVDLNQFIRVPSYLIENSNQMYGWVRVNRVGRKFIVKKFRGTPYARALVYETVTDILRKKVYLTPLLESDVRTFEVHFSFRAYEKNFKFEPPPPIEVSHNRVTIQRYKVGVNKYMKYLMAGTNPASGMAQIGPNLLAPLFDLIEFLQDDDNTLPADVRVLHSSKAFPRQKL